MRISWSAFSSCSPDPISTSTTVRNNSQMQGLKSSSLLLLHPPPNCFTIPPPHPHCGSSTFVEKQFRSVLSLSSSLSILLQFCHKWLTPTRHPISSSCSSLSLPTLLTLSPSTPHCILTQLIQLSNFSLVKYNLET